MTTQDISYPQSSLPSARKLPPDGKAPAAADESASPPMRERLRTAVESGKTRLTEWKGGFEDGVRERPIQSILIATAVGAAIGLLIGRRSR